MRRDLVPSAQSQRTVARPKLLSGTAARLISWQCLSKAYMVTSGEWVTKITVPANVLGGDEDVMTPWDQGSEGAGQQWIAVRCVSAGRFRRSRTLRRENRLGVRERPDPPPLANVTAIVRRARSIPAMTKSHGSAAGLGRFLAFGRFSRPNACIRPDERLKACVLVVRDQRSATASSAGVRLGGDAQRARRGACVCRGRFRKSSRQRLEQK